MSEFGPQEIANTAWAVATLVVKDEPLLEAIAAAAIAKLSEFSPQNLSNTAWAFATLMFPHDPLFEAIAAQALRKIRYFAAQDLANLAWACATLGFSHGPLLAALSSAARRQMSNFSTQNMSNSAWAFATLDLLDVPLRDAISTQVIRLIDLFEAQGSDVPPDGFAMDVTGVVWAFNFAGLLDRELYRRVLLVVSRIGLGMDRRRPPGAQGGDGCAGTAAAATGVPHVELDLPDRLVIHKPPGWEVDTTDVGGAKHLSRFLQSVLYWPLSRDASHSYGFLHRLDTPSSGLILTAKTWEAYYDLKLQLSVGDLIRDYIVLCHGLVPPDRTEISERVYHWRHEGNLPSVVCRKGKPSRTRLKVLAHCTREGEEFSLVAIRIRTGRRHQIRTHTKHIGHPTVCDGKYTSAATFLSDRLWCERNFLHRYRLAFGDRDGTAHEAMAPLPGDLADALRCLAPCTADSTAVLEDCLLGKLLRDWAEFAVLSDSAVGMKPGISG